MFSNSCNCAIRACVYIAQYSHENDCINVKQIARGVDAPEYLIAKLLMKMRQHNLISSIKGVKGGFFMNSSQAKLPIIHLVQLIDGEKLLSACVLGLPKCSSLNPCHLHADYVHIKEAIRGVLESKTIGDLVVASRIAKAKE